MDGLLRVFAYVGLIVTFPSPWFDLLHAGHLAAMQVGAHNQSQKNTRICTLSQLWKVYVSKIIFDNHFLCVENL
jgi:hypothetical protein